MDSKIQLQICRLNIYCLDLPVVYFFNINIGVFNHKMIFHFENCYFLFNLV